MAMMPTAQYVTSMVDVAKAAVETYRQLRDEEGLSHTDALDMVLSEAEEGAMCVIGECGH